MFETYRMLGEQRELELLREARRLQAADVLGSSDPRSSRLARLLSVVRTRGASVGRRPRVAAPLHEPEGGQVLRGKT